ncbi:unnamed protein product [Macrosiphum euphorbiae]|uniref:Uncharacterized protein n=1 Tax=Macrosiphum euphorbiae TaxID=13131 RepID=A0AAV0VX13_9HEMI|nr:unnamed protein product [Macrosiphum euphorbiae]
MYLLTCHRKTEVLCDDAAVTRLCRCTQNLKSQKRTDSVNRTRSVDQGEGDNNIIIFNDTARNASRGRYGTPKIFLEITAGRWKQSRRRRVRRSEDSGTKRSNEEHVVSRVWQTGGKRMRGGRRGWRDRENSKAATTRTDKKTICKYTTAVTGRLVDAARTDTRTNGRPRPWRRVYTQTDTTDGPAAGVRTRLTDTLRAFFVAAAAVAVPVAAAAVVAHGKWPPVSTPIDCAAQHPPPPPPSLLSPRQWRQQPQPTSLTDDDDGLRRKTYLAAHWPEASPSTTPSERRLRLPGDSHHGLRTLHTAS